MSQSISSESMNQGSGILPIYLETGCLDEVSCRLLKQMATNENIEEIHEYYLTEFIGTESSLKLRRPLRLNIQIEDGLFIIETAIFNLFSFSDTLKGAILDIERHFSFLWEEYVLEEENNLTQGSIRLKELLKKYLEECECSQKHIKHGKSSQP